MWRRPRSSVWSLLVTVEFEGQPLAVDDPQRSSLRASSSVHCHCSPSPLRDR
ncbi:hypothetical protein AArc1_3038 [Natrarchaeobaculum sulfurireducens]|uniref:Uncharacterized protein n=1 Tax=Natrarchaeobaculum sulfurireducens TaxID=2044521 RepID=A0A346PIK0_9EURY|nr:hypothetical protein AArc1_3038 [Natrarchaeobaculum sulfurireducens]